MTLRLDDLPIETLILELRDLVMCIEQDRSMLDGLPDGRWPDAKRLERYINRRMGSRAA